MRRKKIQKWNLAFVAICGMVGVIFTLMIIYISEGYFDLSILLGALTTMVILIIINVFKVNLKRDKTPDTDERTVNNLIKFYFYSSHIFLGILLLALGIITFIGINVISITYLWIIIITYLFICGIGALIVSRK